MRGLLRRPKFRFCFRLPSSKPVSRETHGNSASRLVNHFLLRSSLGLRRVGPWRASPVVEGESLCPAAGAVLWRLEVSPQQMEAGQSLRLGTRKMRLTRLVLLSCLCFPIVLVPAHAKLLIKVDQANQRMIVSEWRATFLVACFDGQERVQHSGWHLPSQ